MKHYLSNLLILTTFVIGSLGLTNPAQAHWVESQPNHGHVCTGSTSLNVRSTPYVNSNGVPTGKVTGSVNKGSQVTIIGSYSDWESGSIWYKIYTNNGTGYVSGEYVCF